MPNPTFRSISSRVYDGSYNPDQLSLPFNTAPDRDVHWLQGVNERRRRIFGSRTVAKSVQLVMNETGHFPKMVFINAHEISELTDPDLRYALRLADATNAVGWTSDGPDSKSAHDVIVVATDEGVDSRLLEVLFTGIVKKGTDTFLQNLHNAAPGSSYESGK